MSADMGKEEGGGALAAQAARKPAEGELHLYPVPVKTQSGEKLELQLSPGDSVIDVKQFLLDAPETCFYTCYDLILHNKDGLALQLEDYNEISEIADITTGGCSLEMVAATYVERSIKSHICRVRELLSLSSLHVSPTTSLQQERAQAKNADIGKITGQELDGLRFMEDNTVALTSLLASVPAEIKCVHSLLFSSLNPPSNYRRLHGDLIYIDVVTLEGKQYCITGSYTSFYVNATNGENLDSRPSEPSHEASTLVGLLESISAKFKKGFREILDKISANPIGNVQTLLPVTSWLGFPVQARTEDCVVLSSYSKLCFRIPRDWNEELRSCQELPHGNLQERILRGRALYKVTCDFVDIAVEGAIRIIHGSIPKYSIEDRKCDPRSDADCSSTYVYNNILFCFAADSDYEHMSKDQKTDCRNGPGADPDHAEAQIADTEDITYASVNNDLRGVKSYQEADIPGLYNLATAIIDYRGHRVVAQSIIPGLFQNHKSLLYGSVDDGKEIFWNEAFHAKVVEAAKRLHVKEHLVLDGSDNPVKLAATVDCKGFVGNDGRHYIVDLMGVTPRDSNYIGPQHRFCVLRPELVASFVEAESTKKTLVQKVPDIADTPAESSDSSGEILFNPNVFTEYKLADSPEEIAADEALVKKVGSYLLDTVIPKFVQDLCSLDVSPMDGQTLTNVLHSNGINVRYLGKVAGMVKHLPHLWGLFSSEIIVRSAKHVFKEILRQTLPLATVYINSAPLVAHFLNCFVGKVLAAKVGTGRKKSKTRKAQESSQSAYSHLTSDGVWSDIKKFARYKYQFEVPDDARVGAKTVAVLRNLCQKVGVTIAARKYELDSAVPFEDSDILNLHPIVKHSVPTCTDARKLMEAGKIQMAEGALNEAHAQFSEAFWLLQQINGPMHKDAANCCRYLAMVLYHGGDIEGAIVQQHRELIINEQCLGLDHPDTARSYGNMALFYHRFKQTELGLRHMSHALLLLSLASGPDHPDVAATLINVAMMYQDVSNMGTALKLLQEALKKTERILGSDHIQTSVCYHALAIAFSSVGAYKLSVQHETKAHGILVKQLGSDNSRTKDSENLLKKLKEREKQVNAQKEDPLLKLNAPAPDGAKEARDTNLLSAKVDGKLQ